MNHKSQKKKKKKKQFNQACVKFFESLLVSMVEAASAVSTKI